MGSLLTGLMRQPAMGGLIRPADSGRVFRQTIAPELIAGDVTVCKPKTIPPYRVFRVEMNSVTRRGNKVRSIYYVRESHILTARDVAVKTAGKRGLREILVVKVRDPLSQA